MTDRQELRKRAFSQAFQRMNQQRLGDNHLQPAKRIFSYPLCSTGVCHPEVNQENTIRLDLDLEASVSFEQVPGTQVRHIQSVDLQYANPALYNYASLQYELYGNGPGSELKSGAGAMPPPVVRNLHSAQSILQDSTLPTPEFVRGKSLFGPSPYIRPDSSPPLAAVGDSYVQHGPGPVVYEDGSSPMSDAMTAVGPLTPSALHFGDLSLNSPGYSLPSSSIRGDGQQNRTTVRVVPTSSFASIFPEISPNEVLVLFNNGKEARKADKYPLCSASRFFSRMLDGPFLDPDLRRCIRLRDDFPYAISTMLYFIETGNYECNPHAYTAFPLLTPLDYHIHAYLVSSKYGVVALQERALIAYIDNAAQEMKLGFMMLQSGQASDAQKVAPGYSAIPLTGGRVGGELLTMPIDRFLNSLVLLWKNTPSRYDPLRKAVLKLIKRDLNKFLRVPFFVTLMQEMVGFGDDVVASLGDDGFEVKAFQVSIGGRSQAIRFGV